MLDSIKGKLRLAAPIAAAALGFACASSPVSTDYDTAADFGKYQTYAFMDKDALQGEQYRSLLAKRLEHAITRELQARGYSQAAVGATADLTVDYHAEVEDKQRVISTLEPMHWWGYSWYRPWPAYTYSVRTVDYKEGTLIIHLVDTAAKQMVWQGIMQRSVKRSDLANPTQAIDQAVTEIFSRYPFTAGTGKQ